MADLVREVERELGLPPNASPVGIGTPGSLSRATGLLRGSNSVALNGRPIREDLTALLGREVRITQRRELLRAFRSDRWRGPRRRCRVRRHPRHRRRRRHRRARPRARRSERHRGGVGTQSVAVAARRRAAGTSLLLRTRGLHRDVALGSGHRRRPSRVTGAAMAAAEIVAGAAGGRSGVRGHAWRATRNGWPGRLAHVINIARSRRDRAGRRHVERRASLRQRSAAMGRVGILGPRRHAARQACARRLERRARSRVAVETERDRRVTFRCSSVRRRPRASPSGCSGADP